MGDRSIIAWTDHTANFWMGCSKVSPGCAACYAETLTTGRMGLRGLWGDQGRRQPVKSIWTNLARWQREAAAEGVRRRVFVMSLGDFFEPRPELAGVRARAWEAMAAAPDLDFQILTKRPECIEAGLPAGFAAAPWPNVWLGTSVENDRWTSRLDVLRDTPAAVRFVSAEPLLGPLPSLDLTGIDWVIVGGESGSGYRPMDHAWAREIRDRCDAAGTAFFMKQSAAYRTEIGTALVEADGSAWQWRQYPRTPFEPSGDFSAPVRVS